MIQTNGITAQPPLTPAEARLLLLTSRPKLSLAQQALAADLVAQVTQWPVLVDTAWRKYTLQMVYKNLALLKAAPPPPETLETMRSMALRSTIENMRQRAAFEKFHATCVAPLGLDYAYLKGPALAARFYPDPMQRLYRDIDILVQPQQHVRFLQHMRDQGCRIFRHNEAGTEFLDLDSDLALAEFLFVTPVVHILTPQGQVVDLHAEIDEHTLLFDTDMLLHTAREVSTQQNRIRVLRDPEHFVFICYHHTRHMWSKLNWVADLDAICSHPEFDRDAVMTYARKLKIDSTVMASLELHELASAARHPSDFDRITPGVDLMRACIENFAGDLKLEYALRKGQRFRVIGFDWQSMPVSLWRRSWLHMRKLRPSHDDLRTFGGPRARRYAVALGRRLARAAQSVWTRMVKG